jgi:hypothetical protein
MKYYGGRTKKITKKVHYKYEINFWFNSSPTLMFIVLIMDIRGRRQRAKEIINFEIDH